MTTAEFKNGPNLWGWIIGLAAGLVAFGVCIVVGKFDVMPAAFIAAVIVAGVGLILGMPWGDASRTPSASGRVVPEPTPAVQVRAGAASISPATEAMAASFVAADVPPVRSAAPVSVPEPAAVAAPHPVGEGPLRLTAPRNGRADDLKEIEGIGPALEALCHELGFYHFDQIANWTEADVAWVDHNMPRFKGRIVRDKWVAQAKIIVTEGLEAFRIRAQTNDY